MTDASPTHRLSTDLVALLFVLGWGLPTAQAVCMAPGAMEAGHCGSPETQQHCDGTIGGPSTVCVTHHASQEARSEAETLVDLLPPSGDDPPVRSVASSLRRPSSLFLFVGTAIQRTCPFHARVGVWLE